MIKTAMGGIRPRRYDKKPMLYKSNRLLRLTGLLISAVLPVLVPTCYGDDTYQLDKVVVTAARTAETVDETLASVTVISREQINRSQATSVTELLNQAPGVQISSNGGPGSQSGVFIRGTSTEQTLVLVDGQKINTAEAGSAPLEYLDPDQIERIEIVRGPRSTLYGADAIGGVINILTRKGSGRPSLTIKTGGGSRATGEHSLHFGGASETTRYHVGTRLFETNGYDRTVTKAGFDGDDDAFKNRSLSGSLSYQANGIDTGVNISHAEGKSEYDVNYAQGVQGQPVSHFRLSHINTYLAADLTANWTSRLELGSQRDIRQDQGPMPSSATNKRYSVSWINDLPWSDNQYLTTGVDYTKEMTDTSYENKRQERYNAGLFVQNMTEFSGSQLQVGGRYDSNQVYGDNKTGQVSWGFELHNQMRLVASYGTAFRAPTFINLYAGFSGNPALKPETAKNAELALQGRFNPLGRWRFSVYRNEIKDMIIYAGGRMKNVDTARIEGVELTGSTTVGGWDVSAHLSVLNPENRTLGKKLVRRANRLFAVNVDREFGRWTVGGTFRGQGSAWDSVDNTTNRIAGFGTVDLRSGMTITPDLKTQLKVVNLINKEYAAASGYIDEPLGVFASVTWVLGG